MRHTGFPWAMKSFYRIGICVITLALLHSSIARGAPPINPGLINTLARFTVRLNTSAVTGLSGASVRVTCALMKGGQDLNHHTEFAPLGATSVVVEVASGPFNISIKNPGTSPDNYKCSGAIVHCMFAGSYDETAETFVGKFEDVTASFPNGNHFVSGPFAYAGDPKSSPFVLTSITTNTISFAPLRARTTLGAKVVPKQ